MGALDGMREVPRAIWLLVIAQLCLGVAYATLVPPLHAPDEHVHLDLVRHLATGAAYPEHDELHLDAGVEAAVEEAGLYFIDFRVGPVSPWDGLASDDLPPRGARPTFSQLDDRGRIGGLNWMPTHPPLAYLVDAGAVRALDGLGADPAAWSWSTWVVVVRLVQALLLVPLPLLVWATARRLLVSPRAAVAAAALCLAVPQLTHLGAAVNNDGLLVLLSAVTLHLLVRLAEPTASWRLGGLAGVVAGAAVLTKPFAYAAPAWIALAVFAGWLGHRDLRRSVTQLVAAAVALLAAGGWWPLRELLRHGEVVPTPFGYAEAAEPVVRPLWWLGYVLSRGMRTFWGFFGAEEHTLPWSVHVVATVVAVALLVIGLQGRRAWHADARRVRLAILLAPAVTTLAGVLFGAWQGYARTGVTSGIHGRYLFLALPGLAIIVAAGLEEVAGRYQLGPSLVSAAAGLAALAMQASGLRTVTIDFWEGGWVDGLQAASAWSPWAPLPALGQLGALLALLLAVATTPTRPAGPGHGEPVSRPLADRLRVRP